MSDKPKPIESEGLFSRWSRRKLEPQTESKEPEDSSPKPEQTSTQQQNDKIKSPATKEETLPIWQQEGIDPDTKQTALAALFRQPEFNDVDKMNEYDEDFTRFNPLGKVVTQEMKRMLALAEQKTRSETKANTEIAASNTEVIIASQPTDKNNHDEDDKRA